MDKNTWENYPVGTYVRVTWDDADREEYAVVRGKGTSGGASAGYIGVYIGRHWDEVYDWAGANFEVLYVPKDERTELVSVGEYAYPDAQDDIIREGDLVHLVHNYYDLSGGVLGLVEDLKDDAVLISIPRREGTFWVPLEAVKKAVEG